MYECGVVCVCAPELHAWQVLVKVAQHDRLADRVAQQLEQHALELRLVLGGSSHIHEPST